MNPRQSSRFLLTTFSLGHLANDWPWGAVWLLAPAIAITMELSPSEVGLLITIQSLGASLAYIPAGMLSDRVSNRGRLLLMTFWWVALGYFAASFAPNFWILAAMLAVAGLGDAAWHPIATGVLVQQLPGRRGQALGIHAMGGTLAEVLAPVVVGFLLGFLEWRTVMQLSALPALLMGIAFIPIVKRIPLSPDHAISVADVRHLVKVWCLPAGVGLIGMITVYNMAVLAMMSMMPLFLITEQNYSPVAAGSVFALVLLIGSLIQPVIGRLSDGAGRKRVFVVGSLIATIAALCVPITAGGTPMIAALVVSLSTLVGIRSGVLAQAVEFAGRREATTLGFVFALMDGVGALGAVFAGLAGEFELRYAFVLAAAFSLAAVVIALFTPLQATHTTPEHAPAS
ncbi:MAG: MFS transporter [Gammaproteobacteria bacterium]|nr:MFS transporter [Gammaproteobacteria bacterium]